MIRQLIEEDKLESVGLFYVNWYLYKFVMRNFNYDMIQWRENVEEVIYNVTFKYAMRSGYVYDNPVEKIQTPGKVPKVHREIISDVNLKLLIDNIKPEYKRMNSLARKA